MSIFANTDQSEIRDLMDQLLADLTGDAKAHVVHVDTHTDGDANLTIHGEAHGQIVQRMLSKSFVTETLIGYLQNKIPQAA